MKIKCRTGEIAHSYMEYLTTQHWRDLRVDVFHKAGGKCRCCGKYLTNNFICHHVSTGAYCRIGRERFNRRLFRDDVIAVCRWCHNGKSDNHIKLHRKVSVPKWARVNSKFE